MKKSISYIIVALVTFMSLGLVAKAGISANNSCEEHTNGTSKYQDCVYSIVVTEDTTVNSFVFTLQPEDPSNVTYSNLKNLNNNFSSKLSGNTITSTYVDRVLPKGTYQLFSIRFNAKNANKTCSVGYSFNGLSIMRSCYYDPDTKYYYDAAGNKSTTKTEQYKIDCEDLVCKSGKGSDGVTYYFDGSGNKSTYRTIQYQIDCEPHDCDYIGGIWFDRDGNQVTQAEYESICQRKTCTKSQDGTSWFDLQGNIVTEEVYKEQCLPKPKCEKFDGKWYDNDSKEITEEQYNKICLKYSCKKSKGKFYNKAGDVVTEELYELDCGEKKCRKIADKFFDDQGNEVTEEVYKDKCEKKYCVIHNGKYYDKKGNEVNKTEYEKSCTTQPTPSENPETGAALPIITLISFAFIGAGIILITRNSRMMSRI